MSEYFKDPMRIDQLNEIEHWVTQENGTERPGTGKYLNNKKIGIYVDIVSGEPLFSSDDKYESGCGWPSFDRPAAEGAIAEERDTSHGMIRTEVKCQKCGGHLGHVFPDGPTETGQRYCINSLSIKLEDAKQSTDNG